MVEIRKGIIKTKHSSIEKLENFFTEGLGKDLDGLLYIAYPIIKISETISSIDALWLSEKYGVVVFDLIEEDNDKLLKQERTSYQDDLYYEIKNKLSGTKELRTGRELAVAINILTFSPFIRKSEDEEQRILSEIEELETWGDSKLYQALISSIQSVIKLKAEKTRTYIRKASSKGAIVRDMENTMANLDHEQETAVISFTDGIQRIRGLAGSGKTIILALKASYIHATNPSADIAITFNTRSLRGFFERLIRKFFLYQVGEEPDWSKINIIQAWGSPKSVGMYYEYCLEAKIPYMDLDGARSLKFMNGSLNTEFSEICKKALAESSEKIIEGKYDYILVDEAQDLDQYFLQICSKMIKGKDKNKNLIYAYDELQKLNNAEPLPPPTEIFGKTIKEDDKILHKCYRNSKPILVTAHALGFGIYREKGIVQLFNNTKLWEDVGYKEKNGNRIEPGKEVILCRNEASSPLYLEGIDDIEELIQFQYFENSKEQAQWVANEIKRNLQEEELLPEDLLVINPIAVTTRKEVGIIREVLHSMNINSHIAGDINVDKFFEENSITFTGINRAKGNEAAMVYIINAQDCFSEENINTKIKRNILFTAITRSKGWIRVCGVGDSMKKLTKEFEEVKNKNFCLEFPYPSPEKLKEMEQIYRDVTPKEEKAIGDDEKALKRVANIAKGIKHGTRSIEDYPEHQDILKKISKEND
ncbi:MAG: ATP-binding domain-containing protein [Candidatus Neomarinimicrobiota bacterium]